MGKIKIETLSNYQSRYTEAKENYQKREKEFISFLLSQNKQILQKLQFYQAELQRVSEENLQLIEATLKPHQKNPLNTDEFLVKLLKSLNQLKEQILFERKEKKELLELNKQLVKANKKLTGVATTQVYNEKTIQSTAPSLKPRHSRYFSGHNVWTIS